MNAIRRAESTGAIVIQSGDITCAMTKQNVGDVLWGREDIINGSPLKGFQTDIQLSIFIYKYLNSTHKFPLDVITTQLPVATYGLATVDKCNLRSG